MGRHPGLKDSLGNLRRMSDVESTLNVGFGWRKTMEQQNTTTLPDRYIIGALTAFTALLFGLGIQYFTIRDLKHQLSQTEYDRDHLAQVWQDVRRTPLRVEAYDSNKDGLDDLIINSPMGFTQQFTASLVSGEQHIQYAFNVPDIQRYLWVPYRPTTQSPL